MTRSSFASVTNSLLSCLDAAALTGVSILRDAAFGVTVLGVTVLGDTILGDLGLGIKGSFWAKRREAISI